MLERSTSKAYFAMLICTILWGFMGIYTRRLSEEGLGAMEVSFLRMITSVIILGSIMLVIDREGLNIQRKDLGLFIFFGIFKMLADYFLFVAQVRIHLSLSTVLQLLAPYWVILLSFIAFREKVSIKTIFSACVAIIGCILATGLFEQGLIFDSIGLIFGVLSGFTFAFYAIGNKVLLDRGYQAVTALVYILLFASIACIPFINFGEMIGDIDSRTVVGDLIMIGPLMTLIPYYLQTYSTKILSPTMVMLIALLEVFVATLVGFFYYHEELSPINLIGLVLIPFSIIFMSVNIRQKLRQFSDRKRE